jgi:glyoxylase-like metal-dependent hydrolase (beta-lactamase superfamily II)
MRQCQRERFATRFVVAPPVGRGEISVGRDVIVFERESRLYRTVDNERERRMRIGVLPGMVLIFDLLCASTASAGTDSYAPFELSELAHGIHLLSQPEEFSGPASGNVTIIEQADGIVLIDSGGSRGDGDRIVNAIRALTQKPVKAVVITHWHNDHLQGVSQIVKEWPTVRIIATEETRLGILGPAATVFGPTPSSKADAKIADDIGKFIDQLEAVANNPETDQATRDRYHRAIEQNRAMIPDFAGTILMEPNEILEKERLINDPERPVRVQFLGRANTAGDAIAWLPKQRIIVTGDIVVTPTPFGFFSYPKDWIATIKRIKAFNFSLLVPGHGRPQHDHTYLDRLTATISDIRAQVAPLARQGYGLETVRKAVRFEIQTAIFAQTPRAKRMFDAYWLTPMVENAYKEARGEPIIQGEGSGPS